MFKSFLKLAAFILIGTITHSYALDVTKEAEWQDLQRQLVKKFIKNNVNENKSDLLKLINNELNMSDLLRFGMISRLQGAKCFTQEEVDTLWLHKDQHFFQDILIEYLTGLIIGDDIVRRYQIIDNSIKVTHLSYGQKSKKPSFLYSKIEIRNKLKELCHDFFLRFTTETNSKNQYLQRIIEMILTERTIVKIKQRLADKHTLYLAQTFELSVAFEYAMKWFDLYLKKDKERLIFERKLLSLPSKILILVGLSSLDENDLKTYSKTLAAFTLAVAKNKHKKNNLDYLVDFLIKNKQAQAFEPFLSSSSK
ncbi:MAG: hypothetical protein LBD36_00460 [Holosporales bacterium]|jgi:hypothetical protein|nr:hypothetical protein [Holosporales bacterium]